jgi:hypothetical protein
MNTPTPEPQAYANAQVAAILDPQSGRDTVLITPGSAMPTNIPQGVVVAQTSRGVVITTDPAKVEMVDQGTEEDVGRALFGYGYDQSLGFDSVGVATNQQGIPVAEVAIKPGDEDDVMSLMDMLAPAGGSTKMMPRTNVVDQRVHGLLQNIGG